MSNFALRRGRGLAYPELPPTLQPHAILAAAPASDLRRTAALSGLVYLFLAGGAIALASLGPKTVLAPILPPAPPWRPVELDGPPRARPLERTAPAPAGGGGGEATATHAAAPSREEDPQVPADGLPTVDRSHETPGVGPALPGPAVPAPGPTGIGTGPQIHDFTASAPAILHRVDPLYPELARRARVQGTVVLMMVVDERGVPMQVRVLDGPVPLQDAALQAARQWRFEPAQMDGRPVAASFRLTLNFRLR